MNMPSTGPFTHNLSDTAIRSLKETAWDLLATNDHQVSNGSYTKPSTGQYPHQWNWDSALVAIALAERNVDRALGEISSLLGAQWANGMVPHIVFHDPALRYFPDHSFWQTEAHCQPGFPSSGITQPPVVATALRAIAEQHDISDFIREWYPSIARWHRWFHLDRCLDDSAIAISLHPWESGTDDSPRWLDVMSRITPDTPLDFVRSDTKHVSPAERPTNEDYRRYIYLVDRQRQENWSTGAALAALPFRVQDVLTNSILLRADADLIWLGDSVGMDTTDIKELRETALANFTPTFWDDTRGLFLDRDVHGNQTISVNTAATFMPMWAGIATPEQAQRLVEEHLTNEDEYWAKSGEGYVVTTCAKNEPAWSPIQYWRGPVWVLTNWFIHGGLIRYGYPELAERVRNDTLELLDREGFVEYYDANNGAGCGARAFSWSAALVLDMLK
jgi:glycogen debranching enzyme